MTAQSPRRVGAAPRRFDRSLLLTEPVVTSRTHQTAIAADRERAIAIVGVSRETLGRLDRFTELLLAWQSRINLISPSSIPSLWTRHVADSLQLLEMVEPPAGSSDAHATADRKGGVWLDLGSGGGFPGLVIACALAGVPGTRVHLVESNLKKVAFLREVVRQTKIPAIVHATRIETIASALGGPLGEPPGGPVDYVTARALAPLPELFEMIAPWLKKGAKALLPKGQDLERELTEATKNWNIEATSIPSKTSKAGRILIVHALSKRIPTLP
jgi:16S rRNA (guanine527-N7)-methyltransferase